MEGKHTFQFVMARMYLLHLTLGFPFFLIFATFIWITLRYLHLKRRMKMHSLKPKYPDVEEEFDVIIIGAGPAGSCLATALCRDGRKVLLIDKLLHPKQKISGAGLMTGFRPALKALDLEDVYGEITGVENTRFTIHTPDGNSISIDSSNVYKLAHSYKTYQILRDRAIAEPRCKFITGNVKGLVIEGDCVQGIKYKTASTGGAKVIKAPLTIVADGKDSFLRRVNMRFKPKICTFCCGPSVEKALPQDQDVAHMAITSLGFVIIAPLDKEHTMWLSTFIKPHDRKELRKLASEYPVWMREVYLEAVENDLGHTNAYYLPPVGNFVPGVITLGDAYSCRDPCTASGVTMGLRDAKAWSDLLRMIPDLRDYKAMHAAQNVFCIERKSYSFVNDILAHFLISILSPKTEGGKLLGQGFGSYMSDTNQKERIRGVLGLTTLRDTRPASFFYYMLAIVSHSIMLNVKTFSLKGWRNSFLILVAVAKIIIPHLLYEAMSCIAPWSKPGKLKL